MAGRVKTEKKVIRVHGKLKEIVAVHDEKGNLIHRYVSPLMVEFYPRDILQVMVGAILLAIPVGYTEETWDLAQTLPTLNVLSLIVLSLLFISAFVYYNFYRQRIKEHKLEFFKRIFSTYIISFIVVAFLLTIIQKAPWSTDFLLAIKRSVIVTFPSSMSAAVVDVIK